MRQRSERGFAVIELVIIIVVFVAVGFVVWKLVVKKSSTKASTSSTVAPKNSQPDQPLVLESVGFDLDYYDPKTNHAGDMEFTTVDHSLSGHVHQIWQDFGEQDSRSTDPTKKNPQPTYVLPLHTKVHALVTGEVVDIKKLYSNDYTIWVARSAASKYIYETEHVDNPTVKKGDHVTGGQVIAEVSDKDSEITPGFGLLEIGILYTAHNYPQHLCPYQYLNPAIKDDISKKITALHASWEAYLNQKVYLQPFTLPGCVNTDPVNG